MPTAPRAWRHVLEHVESRLLDGELRPGDHLPGERALSAELGVGRSSVREAFRVLEVLGLIRTQTGSGPSAGAIIIATPQGGMSALMRLQVAASGFPVADIVQTRLLLETAVAADLAEQVSGLRRDAATSLLAPAAQLLDAMDDPGRTPREFLALDAEFHLSLALASGNRVVAATMAGLRSSIEHYVIEGLAALPDWSSTSTRLRAEHRALFDAIAAGDAEAARTRIHEHITDYYAETHLAPTPAPTAESPRIVASSTLEATIRGDSR